MNILDVKTLIEQAVQKGEMSQEEWLRIEAAIHADGIVSEEEKALVIQLQSKIMRGGVKLIS
jgi:hypothetical protein